MLTRKGMGQRSGSDGKKDVGFCLHRDPAGTSIDALPSKHASCWNLKPALSLRRCEGGVGGIECKQWEASQPR